MNTIEHYINRHESYLQQELNAQDIPAQHLKNAIQYAIFSGGKRIRPLLVYMSGELLNTSLDCLDVIASAIELTHCYSLVHDDLPGMDNDDMRRGKASCHRKFDEATAILVGDSLQIMAIDLLLKKLPEFISNNQTITVINTLTTASGPRGMISGQCLDYYELVKSNFDEVNLRRIHNLKTGKLIMACIDMVIAASGHENSTAIHALRNYATNLGLVFQIQDDYLDAYAAATALGKQCSSDTRNAKSTFATHYSRTELFELITQYYDEAHTSLQYFADDAASLKEFTAALQLRTSAASL